MARASIDPRQDLFQAREKLLPAEPGTMESLFLIRPEARLLHPQQRPRARRSQSPGDDTIETHCRPGVGECLAILDRQDLAIDGAPVGAKAETVVDSGLEVAL